jgi:c-di-GMP-binding flagellar brake protein YcgR
MADTPESTTQPAAGDSPARTKPAPVDTSTYSQYLLHSKSEVEFVLQGLYDSGAQITIFFNEGQDLLLTTLIEVTDDHIVFDYGASMEINRKVTTVNRLFCVTQQDKVRIQFILRGLEKIEHNGRPAFRSAMPDEVLRLQRREFYRLTTPIARQLKCTIPVPESEESTMSFDASIVDISGGGISIALPPGISFSIGTVFRGCRFDLPDIGTIKTDLRVCNQFEITLKSGTQVHRAGCEFIKMSGTMLTQVQRYIIMVERERKARESGML